MVVKVKKLVPGAVLPKKAQSNFVVLDYFSIFVSRDR